MVKDDKGQFELLIYLQKPDGTPELVPLEEFSYRAAPQSNIKSGTYVAANPAVNYKIVVKNHSMGRVGVKVYVDGNYVGGDPVELEAKRKGSSATKFEFKGMVKQRQGVFTETPFVFAPTAPENKEAPDTEYGVITAEFLSTLVSPEKVQRTVINPATVVRATQSKNNVFMDVCTIADTTKRPTDVYYTKGATITGSPIAKVDLYYTTKKKLDMLRTLAYMQPATLPTCGLCRSDPVSILCTDCSRKTCVECDALLHLRGPIKEHKRVPAPATIEVFDLTDDDGMNARGDLLPILPHRSVYDTVLHQKLSPQARSLFDKLKPQRNGDNNNNSSSSSSSSSNNNNSAKMSNIVIVSKDSPPICKEAWKTMIQEIKKSRDDVDLTIRYLERYTVSVKDKREGLRGKQGVIAIRDIPANTIIGPYACKVWEQEEFASTIQLHNKLARNSYSLDLETKVGGKALVADAFEYGNLTRFINDPLLDPCNKNNTQKVKEANAQLVEVTIGGWPSIFVVSTAHIPAKSEVLFDYGEDFWDGMPEIMRDHQKYCEIVDAASQ